MRLATTLILGGAAALLAGCGAGLETARDLSPQGSAFHANLHDQYVTRAQHEYDYGDYRSSDYFADKARRAAAGQRVMPATLDEAERLGSAGVLESKQPPIVKGRRDLVDVLNRSARDKAPAVAAEAQVMFDCWLEETQPSHIAECRQRFRDALQKAQAAVAPPQQAAAAPEPEPEAMEPERLTVYFGFDQATLAPGERGKIAEAVRIARESDQPLSFAVTGHADRAGPADYNQRLSLRRAQTVRNALADRGIAPDRISVAARGESEPAVPTADGVREQANRRVEIVVQ